MKTALVTGGNAGIGKETVKALVAQGYEVIVAARDQIKGQAVIKQIRAECPGAKVEFFSLDLSLPDQVNAFAAQVLQRWDHIDALVLNAGLFTPKLYTGVTGHEFMFSTTHLGHFLLTHHLLPLVKASNAGRIVVTSSVAHLMARHMDFAALRQPSNSTFLLAQPFFAYGRSKLANLLFVRELACRLNGTPVLVNAFHPGSVKTEIWRGTPSLFNAIIGPTLVSEAEGAQTQIYLATDPRVKQTGEYWANKRIQKGSSLSRNAALAAELWRYSEQVLGIAKFGHPEVAHDSTLVKRHG